MFSLKIVKWIVRILIGCLRIKSNAKRGGDVENIFVRNIKVGEVKEAIVKLNMHYDPKEEQVKSIIL